MDKLFSQYKIKEIFKTDGLNNNIDKKIIKHLFKKELTFNMSYCRPEFDPWHPWPQAL